MALGVTRVVNRIGMHFDVVVFALLVIDFVYNPLNLKDVDLGVIRREDRYDIADH